MNIIDEDIILSTKNFLYLNICNHLGEKLFYQVEYKKLAFKYMANFLYLGILVNIIGRSIT